MKKYYEFLLLLIQNNKNSTGEILKNITIFKRFPFSSLDQNSLIQIEKFIMEPK